MGIINLIFVYLLLPEPEGRVNVEYSKNINDYLITILNELREPLIGQVLIIFFVVTLSFAAIPVAAPLLAIEYYGFSEVEMSYVFIFIGFLQVMLQGLAIRKLVKWLGEEKLVIIGPLTMMMGVILMPLLRNIVFFGFSIMTIAVGVGIINTAVPSLISFISPPDKQGSSLGINQAIGSIARIPGPVLSGLSTEFIGLSGSFFAGGLILIIPFLLGCRVFRICTVKEFFK